MIFRNITRMLMIALMAPALLALNVGCGSDDDDNRGGTQPTNSVAGGDGGGVTNGTADGIGGGGDECVLAGPDITSPADMARFYLASTPTITVSWTPVPGATSYTLSTTRTDADQWSNPVFFNSPEIADTWYNIDLVTGWYTVTVYAHGPGCTSSQLEWGGESINFSVLAGSELPELASPEIITPEMNEIVYLATYPSVILEWAPVPGATSYSLYWTRTDGDGISNFESFSREWLTDTWYSLDPVAGVYEVTVSANGSGFMGSSSEVVFSVVWLP